MDVKVDNIKPNIGAVVHADREALRDEMFARRCLQLLDERGVLVFPQIGLSDAEQLAFTDKLGARVNFTFSANDVYTVTLDPKINNEPEYVLGTFFWHMDGLTQKIARPKATVLSARRIASKGGQTEFASTYAAYKHLPAEEKREIDNLRVVHSVVASLREVATVEEIDPVRRGFSQEHPLVWTDPSGRKALLVGYTADYVVGMSKPESRALLARLLEWSAQPDFTYRHQWQVGDLVVWDNCGALHRVIPYDRESGRTMHRTSVAGVAA
ncbi:MAG: TauD/TfdA family dioxygenase [Sinobacteraceae bacterium]|nr:TauD/TfdA family dioxygenase [Nevskiaceae bacterium]